MSENTEVVFGRIARRGRPAERVKVNRAGTISVLSIIRALELADNVEFDVRLNKRRKSITLTPVGTNDNDEAEPAVVVEVTPETPPDLAD